MKRLLDFFVALLGLLILAPFFAVVSLIIRWKLGSPIFFTQERPGLNGVPFTLYKFRTMSDERDESGHLLPDAVRLTSLGLFLRKYSLDEWPQLINVLKGELSLVGPRPLLMEYLPLYSEEQKRRHLVKPGITGWAQVNGRNAISWEEKFELDVWYVENQSFWLDLRILWMTFIQVFHTKDVHQTGHVTMEKFSGNRSESKELG